MVAKTLLAKQLRDIAADDNCPFSVELEDDDIFRWKVYFVGPDESLYEGGFYEASLIFPKTFPNQPPSMKIRQEMYHPNIYEDGTVCISILHQPGEDELNPDERPDERWRPILGVEAILVSFLSMLSDPNLNSPANVDAAKMFKEDPDGYRRKVRRLAESTLE